MIHNLSGPFSWRSVIWQERSPGDLLYFRTILLIVCYHLESILLIIYYLSGPLFWLSGICEDQSSDDLWSIRTILLTICYLSGPFSWWSVICQDHFPFDLWSVRIIRLTICYLSGAFFLLDDLLSVRTILLMIMFSQYLKDAWIPIPAKGGMKRYEKRQ